MIQNIIAVFENGVFRPTSPLDIVEGQRVSLKVETPSGSTELSDVEDLLDVDFMDSCRRQSLIVPSLDETQEVASKFCGSLANYISEERDER